MFEIHRTYKVQINTEKSKDVTSLTKKSIDVALSDEKLNREKLLDISSWLVESLRIRLDVKRFKEQRGDSVRLQYIRALVQALQAHNTILKEQEMEEIKARLNQLEGRENV